MTLQTETINIQKQKEIFLNYLKEDPRKGMDKLINFLENRSDFFTAPASTRFHNSVEGGLLDHSLKVRDLLAEKNERFNLGLTETEVNLSGLLHDLCKANIYKKDLRWRKDDNGKWESYESYVCEDTFPMGHGEKSVIMLQFFITLTKNEYFLIRWHMGFAEKESMMYLNNAFDICPAIAAIITSDLEAARLLESSPFEK